jgi:hypothetical protein
MNETPNPRYQIGTTVFRSDDLDELIAMAMAKGTDRRRMIYDHGDGSKVVFVAENFTPIGYTMTQVFPPTWIEFDLMRDELQKWRSQANNRKNFISDLIAQARRHV